MSMTGGRAGGQGATLADPSLFKRTNGPRVAVLRLRPDGTARPYQMTHGLAAVLEEFSVNVAGECWPEEIDSFDVVLASFTSPRDAVAFCRQVPEPPRRARLIVGGFGVYGFLGWRHLTSRIMFGRAEGAVDRIVLGSDALPYCYDHGWDPDLQGGPYQVRRARALLPGETAVGCAGRCSFCQYRAVRPFMGREGFRLPTLLNTPAEDRWADLPLRRGRLMTALDGWNEETRRRVRKPVSDAEVVEKLSRLVEATAGGSVVVKVFQIVGYPWETPDTVRGDLEKFRELLGRVKRGPGRVVLMFINTPFLPEPLTIMEREPCNITADWAAVLRAPGVGGRPGCLIDEPHLNAFNKPQILGPKMRLERVAVARGVSAEVLRAMGRARSLEASMDLVSGIWERDAGDYVSRVLGVEGRE